jgi:hypothetical protein
MTNYHLQVHGLFGGTLGWSYGYYAQSSSVASSVNTTHNSAMSTFWNDATNGLKKYYFTDITVATTSVSSMDASWRTTAVASAALAVTGTDANPSLPWDTAVCLSFDSALDNRHGRGRMKLPSPANDTVASHVFTTAFLASIASVMGVYFSTMTSGLSAYQPVVFNRHALKDGTAPFNTVALTNGTVSDKPATNRNRVRKVIPGRTHTFTI